MRERCPTCGAPDPLLNEFCSDGFHAPGETYWPTDLSTDAGLEGIVCLWCGVRAKSWDEQQVAFRHPPNDCKFASGWICPESRCHWAPARTALGTVAK
jgi:hypothetical protein